MIQQGKQYQSGEQSDATRSPKNIFGALLIIAGVLIAIWVFMNLYRIFTNPQEIEVFKQIVPDNPELRTLDIDGKKVLLPLGIFHFFAYSICGLLLLVGGLMSTGFISSGVNLLIGNVMRIEMSINKAIEGLKKRLDEIKEQFSKTTDST
jgi:hypothetical protein